MEVPSGQTWSLAPASECLLTHKGLLKPTISYDLLPIQPWNDTGILIAVILPSYLEPNQQHPSISPPLFQGSTCLVSCMFIEHCVVPWTLPSCLSASSPITCHSIVGHLGMVPLTRCAPFRKPEAGGWIWSSFDPSIPSYAPATPPHAERIGVTSLLKGWCNKGAIL